MTAVNPEQICYIKTFVKSESQYYRISPERKTWWGKVIPESVRPISALMKDYSSVKEFLDSYISYYVLDGIIYYKPHIEMYFSNNHMVTKYFESRDELNDFIKDELSGIDLKIIE